MAQANIDVPDEWVEAADERNLSIKEYCHRMIRAGRRQFGAEYAIEESPANPQTLKLDGTGSQTDIEATLEQWIYTNLSTDEALDIEGLLDLLEDDLIETADGLCDQGKAKYRRSEGGYTKVSDE
jgi:hypothetical protein